MINLPRVAEDTTPLQSAASDSMLENINPSGWTAINHSRSFVSVGESSSAKTEERTNRKKRERPQMNTSRPRSRDVSACELQKQPEMDTFDGDDLELNDFLAAS